MAILNVVVNTDSLADKASPATAGHLASLTSDGGIADSGVDVAGLIADLAAKAPLESPALTGNPTARTQDAGNNSTRLATTAFVATAVAGASSPTPTLADVLATGHAAGGSDVTGVGHLTLGSDVGLIRDAAGRVRVTDGTPGGYGDLRCVTIHPNGLLGADDDWYHAPSGVIHNSAGSTRWTTGVHVYDAVDLQLDRVSAKTARLHDGSGGAADLAVTGEVSAASFATSDFVNATTFKVFGEPGVTATVSNPTSITVKGGIITAIS